MSAFEVNFDGLVGPTHNYAGLSYGNVASMSHKAVISNPKEAALQGLRKMQAMAALGIKQAVLPPQQRPDLKVLRSLGFIGTDKDVLLTAFQRSPEILASACSASSMWTANAATVAPSADTRDGKVHFTPANLVDKFHRSIEAPTTSRILKSIFSHAHYFVHHSALPASKTFSDEGAANHNRFCSDYGNAGIQFFVYGRLGFDNFNSIEPKKFPARQTLEASQAIARKHQLQETQTYFAQQNPSIIDAGAFHNDVAGVGNKNVLFYHEEAYLESSKVIAGLSHQFEQLSGEQFFAIEVKTNQVPVADAIKSYLFNSQLVTLPDGSMCLIAPTDCQAIESVQRYLEELIAKGDTPIRQIKYFDLRQSMQNGGGPACLRLRVVLKTVELHHANQGVFIDDEILLTLNTWVERHYRDRLTIEDLADPQLVVETQTALDELTRILKLGVIYPFQLEN
jgi:succinylarginine dihydrolase